MDSGCRTDSGGRGDQAGGKRTASHTRTPSSERQFGSMSASEGCSKEGSTSDGYPCRYACCPARTARELEGAGKPPPPLRSRGMVRESYTLEDSARYYKDSSDDQERRQVGGSDKGASGGGHHLQKALSTTTAAASSSAPTSGGRSDSPSDWKTEKDLKKWREMDSACLNGAEVWRERGDTRERVVVAPTCMEPVMLPPPPPLRRAVRSETPDDDSVSFHETLGRELRYSTVPR